MRIISGRYKGRKIMMPAGIRPTQNKVRKAIFDILGDIEGLSFLELFAGSGAVGFEALSSGVSGLTLAECNRECISVINKNVESFAPGVCDLCPKEAQDAIKTLFKHKKVFDIIFLDPPYFEGLAKKTLQILEAYDILAPNGFVVVQHFKRDELKKEPGKLVLIKESRYGDTVLSFYRKSQKHVPEGNIPRDF